MMVLAIVSVTLMSLDHRTDYVNNIRAGLSLIIYPVRYVMNIPSDIFGWGQETFVSRDTLQKQNETLITQNKILKAQLQKFTFTEAENIRLRNLLKSSKRVGERILIAELLSVNLDPYRQQVVINKGLSERDIFMGQPILDADGIMGQVVHVNPVTSTAMLITDPSHALPVQSLRNGIRAIAVGKGASGLLELINLPNNTDIKVGDKLVTSGMGCVFPAGYPAAEVTEVNINPSLPFAQVLARPAAKLDRSSEVLLVWMSDESRKKINIACSKDESSESKVKAEAK